MTMTSGLKGHRSRSTGMVTRLSIGYKPGLRRVAAWLVEIQQRIQTGRSDLPAAGIPDDPCLAETFYEQEEFASDSDDGDEDLEIMCTNLQSVLSNSTCTYRKTLPYLTVKACDRLTPRPQRQLTAISTDIVFSILNVSSRDTFLDTATL